MKVAKNIIFVMITFYASSVYAYKIIKPAVHESMTRASIACFHQAFLQNKMPTTCALQLDGNEDVNVSWMHDSSLSFYDMHGWIKRALNYTADYPDLEEAVRWPDDPTQELSLQGGFYKFGNKLLFDVCEKYRNPATKHLDINAGLICASHFGDLEFLHAQASDLNESAIVTHKKIIAWASLLYEIASGKLSDEDLNQSYQSYFSNNTDFDKAMLPSKHSIPITSKNGIWRLKTLFNLTCSGPKPSSWGCHEWTGLASYDKARIIATGALLHLIQDSYSQSHTKRGTCKINEKKVIAKIECLPIEYFTTYKGQKNHDDADQMPSFKESCTTSKTIDNPILAGAKTLWFINENDKKKGSLENFKTHVLYRVFSTPEYIKKHGKRAELGECFR